MAFRAEGPEQETKAHEISIQLDEIMLNNDSRLLEKAIRFMGQNTRETMKRALEMAERN